MKYAERPQVLIPFFGIGRDRKSRAWTSFCAPDLTKGICDSVWHSMYVTFQLAEVAVPRQLFAAILERIGRLAIAARGVSIRLRSPVGQNTKSVLGESDGECMAFGRETTLKLLCGGASDVGTVCETKFLAGESAYLLGFHAAFC